MVVKVPVMDQDPYTGPREIANTSLTLKEAKQTVQVSVRQTQIYALMDKKQLEIGANIC